jgi:UDP-3-O-[3-hydroxymyristoyl] glucosamine N-acyltransferase
VIRVDSPDQALAVAAPLLAPPPPELAPGVHPSAVVADDVELGEGVRIGPHVVIERGAKIGAGSALWAGCYIGVEAVVGENCVLYPLSSLRERVRLGDRVIIHNGAVIGSDGFGYLPEKDGSWTKILQVGIVEIGDDSEIGANVTVDRARFGKTVIGKGVKIDNLVQVAHNVQIGDHTAMAAQVGISGTTKIGKHVRMGGQVGLAGHLSVGDGAILGAQSGISKDVKPGAFMFGSPASPIDKTMKAQASLLRLPKLKKRMAELERRLAALEAQGEEAKH